MTARRLPGRILALTPGDRRDDSCVELVRRARAAIEAGLDDRVHLARAAQADAVHVGFRSLRVADARAILPETIAIGFSAHAHDDSGAWTGADYLVFGPVFATPSKAGVLDPIGVEGLARAAASTRVPMWALGGIDASNVPAASRSGCEGVAVRAALLGTPPSTCVSTHFRALRSSIRPNN